MNTEILVNNKPMNKILLVISACFLFVLFSCEEDYYEKKSIYGYENLNSIIDTLKSDPDFSKFVNLLEKSNVDDLLVKGTVYSVFAPTNQAIDDYNQKNPGKSTENLDSLGLKKFVEYHIVFGIYYKYDFNKKYREKSENRYQTRLYNKEFNRYKYLSVFPESYFGGVGKVSYSGEYAGIYQREYVPNDSVFFVEAAKVLKDKMDISCSNGVIHGVDAVIEPKLNAFEYLKNDPNFSTYFSFINRYDTLVPVYSEGKLSYYNQEYWYKDENKILRQLTGLPYNSEENDITLFAPDNQVLNDFFGPYLVNFGGDIKNLPDDLVTGLLKYNFADIGRNKKRLYKEDMKGGIRMADYRNIFNPIEYLSNEPIVLSNGFIYPVRKLMAQPRLSSITGKILLDPRFESYRYMMEESGYINTISNGEYVSNEYLFGEKVKYPESWTLIAPAQYVFSDSITKSVYDMTISSLRDAASFFIIPDSIFLTEEAMGNEFEKGARVGQFKDGYYSTIRGVFMRKQGNTLYSSLFPDSTAQIIDYQVGSNGIVYIVDDYLWGTNPSFTVYSQLTRNKNSILTYYTELTNGLHSELLQEELLQWNRDFTLFIPTDEAMNAYNLRAESDDKLKTWNQMDTAERDIFLRNHIVRKRMMITNPTNEVFFSSVGNKLTLFKDKGQIRIKGTHASQAAASFKILNEQGSNGIVNIIDQVLLP